MATRQLKASDYVHLHNHTQYSLLDGLTRIPPLMDLVRDKGMQAIAVTDHGTLSGALEFYQEATARKLKPIIGIETYVAARKHTDKDPTRDKARHHLILLAMNDQGYQNLMRLSTIANLEGFYYYPRIDHNLLERYNDGLIVLSACMGSEIGEALKQGQYEQAKKTAQWYKSVFSDRYYLEVQDHGHPKHPLANAEQRLVNEQILKLGKELNIAVVLTCDAHYLNQEDKDAHEVLLCIGTGSFLQDENRMSLKDFPLHVTDPNELIERWGQEYPEVILNSKRIADRCSVSITFGNILLPKFPVPKGETELSYLEKLVYRGLAWRYSGITEEKADSLTKIQAVKRLPEIVKKRAEYELEVVEKMGFCSYFLIISDFIRWGKNQGIVFGPGRGSAAGSIIAYGLRVTELDPLEYNLLFERFLNPDRISLPDIDIDIQDTRRDEVIQYCIDKYGKDRVANIVTFGRMFARNAVRDVARVLQVPYTEADRLAKMIPPPVQGRHIPLSESLKHDAALRAEYENNQVAREVLTQAMRLEGTVRSHSVHAAGVVIAPDEIIKFVPLEKSQKGVIATQYSMGPVNELGLLKIDFLGLSNLTIIKNALRIVRKVYGKDIDISNVPLDDRETYELFQRGDTTGIFQLESAGMKRYLKELKPTVFDDIIAMVALYRPGPMQFIEDFIARKHGQKKIEYLHPKMKNALKSTYGVLVYQEQFMQISKDLAGFTGGQADTLRKAVGKKIMSLMKKIKPEFIEGAVEHSQVDRSLMEKFWGQLEEFANYCFNKSHAACYALIAYWTAYLKARYPDAFMAALMTSDYDDTDRLAIEIGECKHMGIDVLPPDINESFVEFAVVKGTSQIRFGLAAIKNVGVGAVEEILKAREDGPFKSIEEFFERVNAGSVNRKTIESLIKAGAFDRFEQRGLLLANLEALLAYGARVHRQAASGQMDLFGNASLGPTTKPRLALDDTVSQPTQRELLLWERELLGLYLSQHPLASFQAILEETTVSLNSLTQEHDGRTVTVGGAVQDAREITTRNGQKMAFVKVTDQLKEIELLLFPSVYQQTLGLWVRDKVVVASGKVTAKDRDGTPSAELKIIVNNAREITLEQAQAYQPTGKKPKPPTKQKIAQQRTTPFAESVEDLHKRVYVRLRDSNDSNLLLSLKDFIDKHTGNTEVVLVVGPPESKQILRLPMRVSISDETLTILSGLVGEANLKLR